MATKLDDLIDEFGVDRVEIAKGARELATMANAYKLRELREAAGLTQVEMAKLMGVSQNRVSRIERGLLSKTEIGTLEKYCGVFQGVILMQVKIGDKVWPLIGAAHPALEMGKEPK